MPPEARLGAAPRLQELREPSRPVDVVPRHVLQQDAPRPWPARVGSAGLATAGGGLVMGALLTGLSYLLSFKDRELTREVVIPVELKVEPAKGSAVAGNGASAPAPPEAPPPAKPATPSPDAKLAAALARPVGAAGPPPGPAEVSAPPSRPAEGAPPELVAPPSEAARAASQDKENKPANLVPDEHQADQATREARPAAIPKVLTTQDRTASSSVPLPLPAKAPPAPAEPPTPPIPAKTPGQADRLAAALPLMATDAAAMPMSFRAVLAGNADAQINAAYAGVVQGRIRQAQAELSDTAYREHLSGAVAVSFTIDGEGKLAGLGIAQSSGNARLDALALHAVELAAPFPPPPPEAERTFRKAFLIGG